MTVPTDDKFVMINHSVLDYGLTPQAFTIYAAMTKNADWSTRETYVSRGTLAKAIGTKQPRSADKYVRELVEAGLITSVRHRWTTQNRDMADVVFSKDDEHPVQTSSLYVISPAPATSPQVSPQCATTHGGGAPERTGVVRQNAHNHEPLIKNHLDDEKTSVAAGVDPVDDLRRRGEETAEPMPLHPEWAPNNANRSEAERLGLDVDTMAQAFRVSLDAFGNRGCWGAAFTKFLQDFAEDRSDTTFGVSNDDVAEVALDAVAEQFRDVTANVEVTVPPAQPDPVVVGEEIPASPAPVVLDFSPRSLVTDLHWLARMVGVVTPMRSSERAEAERLLAAGESRESVKVTILGMRKAKRAMLERRAPAPIPA